MLCRPFKDMNDDDWDKAPRDTNGVERINGLSKTSGSIPSLYVAMETLYKKDKAMLLQHIAAARHCSVSYRSEQENRKREGAKTRKRKTIISQDSCAQYGPPDKSYHLDLPASSKKLKLTSDISLCSPIMGREVEVLYDDEIWYRGKVISFNTKTGKWTVLFYDDNETTEVAFPDNDVRFL